MSEHIKKWTLAYKKKGGGGGRDILVLIKYRKGKQSITSVWLSMYLLWCPGKPQIINVQPDFREALKNGV